MQRSQSILEVIEYLNWEPFILFSITFYYGGYQ